MGRLSPSLVRSKIQQQRLHKSAAEVKLAPRKISRERLLGFLSDPRSVFPLQTHGPFTHSLLRTDYQESAAQWEGGVRSSSSFWDGEEGGTHLLGHLPSRDCRVVVNLEEEGVIH